MAWRDKVCLIDEGSGAEEARIHFSAPLCSKRRLSESPALPGSPDPNPANDPSARTMLAIDQSRISLRHAHLAPNYPLPVGLFGFRFCGFGRTSAHFEENCQSCRGLGLPNRVGPGLANSVHLRRNTLKKRPIRCHVAEQARRMHRLESVSREQALIAGCG